MKAEAGSFDRMYRYARASLLHYARWMEAHARPFLDKPEELEFPTETWPAQDIRKVDIFLHAARQPAPRPSATPSWRARLVLPLRGGHAVRDAHEDAVPARRHPDGQRLHAQLVRAPSGGVGGADRGNARELRRADGVRGAEDGGDEAGEADRRGRRRRRQWR